MPFASKLLFSNHDRNAWWCHESLLAELTGADERRVHVKNTGYMTLTAIRGNSL